MEECRDKYQDAIGAGKCKVRPGSISEFAVLHYAQWMESRVKELSASRYDVSWRNQVGPIFGHLLFDELTPTIIQEGLMQCGNSGSTQDLAKTVLGQICKLAVSLGKCSHHVLTMISLARVLPKQPKERIDIERKADAILAAAKGTYLEGPFWLMRTLGLRWGELCGLKLLDFDGKTLTVQRQRNNKTGEVPYTKHRSPGKRRVIGLPPQLATTLQSYVNGSMYMFSGPDGAPLDYTHNERKLAPLMKQSGIAEFDVHDFRAAAIASLYGRVDEKTFYNLFGHRAIQQSREYLDSSETQTRDALGILVNL